MTGSSVGHYRVTAKIGAGGMGEVYRATDSKLGREADVRSDVFAFGAVLYEMATGKRVFESKTQASLIAAILKEGPRPLWIRAGSTQPQVIGAELRGPRNPFA